MPLGQGIFALTVALALAGSWGMQRLGLIRQPVLMALILSIRRDHSLLAPHADTVVRLGDSLVVLGSPDAVARALSLLGGG